MKKGNIMNELDIKKLVVEDENTFFSDKNNQNCFLLKALTRKDLRDEYYSNIDLNYYTMDNYIRLKKYYYKVSDQIDRLSYINQKLVNHGIILDILVNQIDSLQIDCMIKKEKINEFNNKLSHMLYLGIISEKEALNRGFTRKHIRRLNRMSQNQIEMAYDSYLNGYELDKEQVKIKRY